MSAIILFYQNKLKANNKDGYYLENILKWPDYRLEIEHDFIQWLFPDKTGGVNLKAPKLTKKDIEIFRTDEKIRTNVARATARMLLFYGFAFVKSGVEQVKALGRKEKGIYVGLYSEHNYSRITRMMSFLNKIDMKLASSLIMLAICFSMHTDLVLRTKIKNSGALDHWFSEQEYLHPYTKNYNIDIMGIEETDNEEEETDNEDACRFTGLRYTGNSCYQDSTMLALFAIPVDFITENILRKNIKPISSRPNREIVCGKTPAMDYERRLAIQKELNRITGSMRGDIPVSERVQYCSNLRALLRSCPSASRQEFYSTGTQDAGEFLQYLFSLFQVNGLHRIRTTDITNDLSDIPAKTLTTRQIEEEVSPVILIPAPSLASHPKSNIDFYLVQTDDSVLDRKNLVRGPDGREYRRRIEQTIVTQGDYAVFYAQRLILDGRGVKKIHNKIVPSEKIQLPMSDKPLNLFAVVVHRDVHYTCYIKCDTKWFYYNDMSSNIVPIGTYKDLLKNSPSVQSEGVLYFYKV